MITNKIPEEVNICAIMYRVVEVDEMIIFTELYGMNYCGTRMAFTHPKFASWQVVCMPVFGDTMMVAHIVEAYKLVCKWRGDDFGREIKDES